MPRTWKYSSKTGRMDIGLTDHELVTEYGTFEILENKDDYRFTNYSLTLTIMGIESVAAASAIATAIDAELSNMPDIHAALQINLYSVKFANGDSTLVCAHNEQMVRSMIAHDAITFPNWEKCNIKLLEMNTAMPRGIYAAKK